MTALSKGTRGEGGGGRVDEMVTWGIIGWGRGQEVKGEGGGQGQHDKLQDRHAAAR